MSVVQNYHAKFIIQRVLEKNFHLAVSPYWGKKPGSLFSGNCKRSLTFIPWGMTVQHLDCIPWLNTLCVLWMHWAQKTSEFFFLKKLSRFSKKEVLKGKKSWLVTTHSNGNNRGMSYAQKYVKGFFKVHFGYVCFIQQDASCFNLQNSQSDNLVP